MSDAIDVRHRTFWQQAFFHATMALANEYATHDAASRAAAYADYALKEASERKAVPPSD